MTKEQAQAHARMLRTLTVYTHSRMTDTDREVKIEIPALLKTKLKKGKKR